MTIDPVIELTLAMSLSLVYFMAARHKMADLPRFRAQLMAYEIVPMPLLKPVAAVLPWLEFYIFATLLLPWTRPFAAVLAMSLFTIYALGMAVNLLRGRDDIDCGCGGRPQALSWWLVMRNGLLTLLASLLLMPVVERSLLWTDVPLMALSTLLLAMLYMAVGQLVTNHSAMARESQS